MLLLRKLEQALQGQHGNLLLWVPVCLAIGIGTFFSLRFEPELPLLATCLAGVCLLLIGAKTIPAVRILFLALVFVLSGFLLAAQRSNSIAAPVLDFRYYGPVEGRLIAVDRSSRDRIRLTLDRVFLPRISKHKLPKILRISIVADSWHLPPGTRLALTAHLMPPQAPVEPGGFDFRRHAWFLKLGAIGYSRTPVMVTAPAEDPFSLAGLRWSLAEAIRQRLPGDTGALAAAITTGDRSEITQSIYKDLRASNLAHLLAISGLHMGLLSGFVFAVIRFGLSLWPYVALRWDLKKLAALSGLGAASAYLTISGGNVATERAFIMVSVFFLAILCNRRALSLRAVAIAAILILLRRPESLLSAGFQMSFAATTALVVVFTWIRDSSFTLGPGWMRPVIGLVISSAVAGFATAPFGAAHFNLLSHYGLLANLLAVPVMGIVVIPAAVLALCLAPIGLEQLGLNLMALGLDWILWVGGWISSFPSSQSGIHAPMPWVLPLLSCGALVLMCWRGRIRALGGFAVVAALGLWWGSPRPMVLISNDGSVIGVLRDETRHISQPGSGGFAARSWAQRDGTRAIGNTPTHRETGWQNPLQINGVAQMETPSGLLIHIRGKRAAAQIEHCGEGDILVSNVDLQVKGPCLILSPSALGQLGSVGFDRSGQMTSVRDHSGNRLWSPAQK